MRRRSWLLGALALPAACAAPEPPRIVQPLDPRVSVAPDVAVAAGIPLVVRQPDGSQRFSLVLANPSPLDRPVLHRVEWFDGDGLPLSSNLSSPRRMTVPRFGEARVDGISPNPRAATFRIVIERDPLAAA